MIQLAVLYHVSLDYLAGIDKKESVTSEEMTEEQKEILKSIIEGGHDRKSRSCRGVTKRQQENVNQLLIQVQRPI